nr:MAG TPA: hypothetical protein [Caudoviricetes sp.]
MYAFDIADGCIRFGIDVNIFMLYTVFCVVVDVLQNIIEGFLAMVHPSTKFIRKAKDPSAAHIGTVSLICIDVQLQLIVYGSHAGYNLILLILLAINTMQQPANNGSQRSRSEDGKCNFHRLYLRVGRFDQYIQLAALFIGQFIYHVEHTDFFLCNFRRFVILVRDKDSQHFCSSIRHLKLPPLPYYIFVRLHRQLGQAGYQHLL